MPKRFTKEEFVERSNNRHKNKYDYSKVEYINTITKVCIICSEHGEFWQRPSDHMNGHGCPVCGGVKYSNTEDFTKKAKQVHCDRYDYSKVKYINNKTKVCIICPKHGEFWQRPNDHLSGYGCKKCGDNDVKDTKEFINKSNIIHKNKYDYSKVNYVNAHTKVCIICPEHGEFWQTPINHYHYNCPSCNANRKSKMEEKIGEMLNLCDIKYERQKTFEWLKHKKNLFLDYFLPQYNVAIEVMGEQHFRSIKRFGGEVFFEKQKERDKVKDELCKVHNIKLFYITKSKYNINEIIEYINETTKEKNYI